MMGQVVRRYNQFSGPLEKVAIDCDEDGATLAARLADAKRTPGGLFTYTETDSGLTVGIEPELVVTTRL
jgi:hypothetical protein